MKLDDLLASESPDDDGPIDDIIINAMGALGFTHVSYHLSKILSIYAGVITGTRADGTITHWQGVGKTPEEAETNAIDDLAKWINQQQVGASTP